MRSKGAVSQAIVLLATWLFLGACVPGEQAGADAVMARYRGGELTRAEFNDYVERRAKAGRSLVQGEKDWRIALLERLAVTEIAAAAATESAALAGSVAEATESILEAAMIARLGWDDLEVDAEEVRRFYEEHPEMFVEPEKLRLQHIFLRAPQRALSAEKREVVRRRLAGLRQLIVAGADFAAVAREHSDSADGRGGGWMVLERGARAVRSFTDVVWSLEEGQISEPIDTPTGFQIARVAARIAPVERAFEEARRLARRALLKTARSDLEDAFLAERGPRYGLERRYEALGDPQAGGRSVLFSLEGLEYTLQDLMTTLRDPYRSHYYAGYLHALPGVLDQLALRRLLILEAGAEGLEDDPEVRGAIAQAILRMRANFELERRLAERGRTLPEQDLVEFFEQHPRRYETPRIRSLSVIRLASEGDRSLRTLLEDGRRLADEIRSGADFAEIARQRSRHASAAAGGRLTNLADDGVRTQVQSRAMGRQLVDDLRVGEVSNAFVGEVYDPLKPGYEPVGVYIVRLDSELPARRAEFDEVGERVRSDYLHRHRARLLAELENDILAEAGFEIIEANIPELGG